MSRSLFATLFVLGIATSTALAPPAFAASKKASSAPSQTNSADPVVAIVNGESIHRSDVKAVLQQVMPAGQQPTEDDLKRLYPRIINDLISRKLAYQEAVKEKLANDPEVKRAIAAADQQIIEQAYFNKIGKPATTEENMRAAYDQAIKTAPKGEEVHARHILVKTEDEAKDIIKQLDGGADFAKLAQEKSIDKGNAKDGGDLGYFQKESMDPTFADAAFSMQPNTYSKTPVKTGFGYHVIQVLDKRPAKIPTYDEAKPQLKNAVAQKAIQENLQGLAKKSNVQVFNLDGSPLTPQAAPAAAAPAAGGAQTPAAPAAPEGEKVTPLQLPATPPTP